MTIPFFSGDAGRSLLIQRGTDSYGEEGRRLQYTVGNSWRPFSTRRCANDKCYPELVEGLRATRYAIAQLVESEKMSVLGNLAAEVADKITAVLIYLNHISCRGTALLYPTPRVYLPGNSCNNPVGLIVVNLQSALDEVFHARS
ncbi:MAG: hypothetical protein V7K14_15970 [Nostoc sp.]|uniref:hypothetical protein n=1 Tax=Nostoc sp. TaxID=1180 RepID=UPI002FF4AA80